LNQLRGVSHGHEYEAERDHNNPLPHERDARYTTDATPIRKRPYG
jgi:hypothetical protein